MYIAIDSEATGEATDPVDVRPCGEAETDGSYGYESHTHELNMALGEPPEGRYRHPLDWPSRKLGLQQILYPTHEIYRAQRENISACLTWTLLDWACEFDAADGEPDTLPSWQLGSSV